MRSTQQFSITLPHEMADAVRAKVAAGEYATESEVIRDGLRVLLARDRAVEDWLRNDVAAAYDALKADPSRAVGADAVKARRERCLLRPRPGRPRDATVRVGDRIASGPWCVVTQTEAEPLGVGLLAAPLQRVQVPPRQASVHRVAGPR
jgi:putative addiction module CopG family antidote